MMEHSLCQLEAPPETQKIGKKSCLLFYLFFWGGREANPFGVLPKEDASTFDFHFSLDDTLVSTLSQIVIYYKTALILPISFFCSKVCIENPRLDAESMAGMIYWCYSFWDVARNTYQMPLNSKLKNASSP